MKFSIILLKTSALLSATLILTSISAFAVEFPRASFVSSRVTLIAGRTQALDYVITNSTNKEIQLDCVQILNVGIVVRDAGGNEAPRPHHISRVYTRCIPTILESGKSAKLRLDLSGWGYELSPGEYDVSGTLLAAGPSSVTHVHVSVRAN